MSQFTPLQRAVLQLAKSLIGTREATGHNDGPEVSRFIRFVGLGLARVPWCAAYVVFVCKQGAKRAGVPSLLPLTASTSTLYHWGKAHGRLLSHPIPGCIGLLRGGLTGHKHTFLVHDLSPQGELITIEGNFSNRVRWNHRPRAGVDFLEIC